MTRSYDSGAQFLVFRKMLRDTFGGSLARLDNLLRPLGVVVDAERDRTGRIGGETDLGPTRQPTGVRQISLGHISGTTETR